MNREGTTVFIEDDSMWIERVLKRDGALCVVPATFNTKLENWAAVMNRTEEMGLDIPETVSGRVWDVILVDGPKGWLDQHPGRVKSIFQAVQLVTDGGSIFVHDCRREVESACCDRFLGGMLVIGEVARLRHYKSNCHAIPLRAYA